MSEVKHYKFAELSFGQKASFNHTVQEDDLEGFSNISGDISPLHLDTAFARSKGFEHRVVHGAFLVSLISQLVGVHLPGCHSLVHSFDVKFSKPAYIGDELIVTGEIDHVSAATRAITLKVRITRAKDEEVLVKAKVIVGVTD